MLTFLRDAAFGNTVLHKGKKIGHARLINYIKHLQPVIAYLKANLDKISQSDMERFVEAPETDQIVSRSLRVVGTAL